VSAFFGGCFLYVHRLKVMYPLTKINHRGRECYWKLSGDPCGGGSSATGAEQPVSRPTRFARLPYVLRPVRHTAC
jgi:hypothetical protein